jgi:hypothetical protein
MKPMTVLSTGLLLLAVASFGYSQSLADLAKKEKERRQAVKGTVKVITSAEATKYQNAPVTTSVPPPARSAEKIAVADAAPPNEKLPAEGEAKTEAPPATQNAKPSASEPTDYFGRTESFWKQAFADARQKVKDLENESNVIILKLNDLQNRFYRESDGFRQQAIQREIQKTFYEQDVNKQNLEKAKSALDDLEREARRSGALPGWVKEPGHQ